MQKIILLVGDSGSGKDYILNIFNKYSNVEVVKRYISRKPRMGEEDSISAIFSVDIERIKKTSYYYEGAEKGRWYGIEKVDLDSVLDKGKVPVVVCPNFQNFLQISRDFPERVLNYFVYRGYDDSELDSWRQSLIARGSSLEEIAAREEKRDKYFRELYIDQFCDYSSNVILNIYGLTTEEDICLQLEGLAEKNEIDIGKYQNELASGKNI